MMNDYQKRLIQRGFIFRPTIDNWAPNFPDNLVAMAVIPLSDGKFRVVIMGADDTGLEIDLSTQEEANRIFSELPSIISFKELWTRGFRYM